MRSFGSSEALGVLLLGAVVAVHIKWRDLISTIVPDPYLDEVFHIPQAQAYWHGQWSHWDPKITTPPALYYFSWLIGKARALLDPDFDLTTGELRFVSFLSLYLLLGALHIWKRVSNSTSTSTSTSTSSGGLLPELAIVLSPLLFFFSGLYYTDLFSALTVVVTYIFWLASASASASAPASGNRQALFQLLHFVFGALSLLARQTNIFWVAIFLGGLQVLRTVEALFSAEIHDPEISEASLDDVPATAASLVQCMLSHASNEDFIFQLLSDLWPSISLLAAFTGFVIGNGGVVLGDKSNHVATIHLAQMLYFWPAVVFFSWPALLPFLADILTTPAPPPPPPAPPSSASASASASASTSTAAVAAALRARFPRTAVVLGFLALFTLIVHYNTIVHPFILADNRHYTFYVFRILRTRPWIKYAAVPVYLFCAWLCISALGGRCPGGQGQGQGQVQAQKGQRGQGQRVGWLIVFLISTSLSLITAPLVEPRYFLIPWLVWRMNLGLTRERQPSGSGSGSGSDNQEEESRLGLLRLTQTLSVWLEVAWYGLVNAVTCWVFLHRGFSWAQEPGNVQRFMW